MHQIENRILIVIVNVCKLTGNLRISLVYPFADLLVIFNQLDEILTFDISIDSRPTALGP